MKQVKRSKTKSNSSDLDNSKGKSLFKTIIFISAFTVLMAVIAISNLRDRVNTEATILSLKCETISKPITSQEKYIQTFISDGSFNRIKLQFVLLEEVNETDINIKLIDNSTKKIIGDWDIDNSVISENPAIFDLKEDADEGHYTLEIENQNQNPETSVGIYLQNKSIYSGTLLISNSIQDKNISIGLYKVTNIGAILCTVSICVAIIWVWITYIFLFVYKCDIWKIALALIMGFGSIYILIFPAGCINDSWNHYITVYQYSNRILGIIESESGTVMMRADDCKEFLRYRKLGRFPSPSISAYEQEFDEFSLWCQDDTLLDCGEKSLSITDSGAAVSVIAYLPQILGLTFGRCLSFGTIPCMIIARMFQLISVAFLIAVSIKMTPTNKELFLLVALLPISMQQISAFSYDGIAFGISFVFIAMCMKLQIENAKASNLDYMFLLIITIGLCACRGGMYIFLLFLLLAIPKQILSIPQKLYLFGIGIFTVITVFGESYFKTPTIAERTILIYGSPIEHPIDVCMHFVSSIIENLDVYLGGAFGNRMGWNESIIPFSIVFGFVLIMIFVSLPNYKEKMIFSIKNRIVYLLPILTVLGFCLGTMYLNGTSGNTKWNIRGVQGRYLIPVLPLLFFQIKNSSIVMKKDVRFLAVFSFCALKVFEIFYLMRSYITR